jgi:hypothetical protein
VTPARGGTVGEDAKPDFGSASTSVGSADQIVVLFVTAASQRPPVLPWCRERAPGHSALRANNPSGRIARIRAGELACGGRLSWLLSAFPLELAGTLDLACGTTIGTAEARWIGLYLGWKIVH